MSPIPQSTSTSVRTSTSSFCRRTRPRAPCGPAVFVAHVSSQFRVGHRRRRRREKTGSRRRNVNPSGDDPWEKKRMPVSPAAVSSSGPTAAVTGSSTSPSGEQFFPLLSLLGKENIDRCKFDKHGFCKSWSSPRGMSG